MVAGPNKLKAKFGHLQFQKGANPQNERMPIYYHNDKSRLISLPIYNHNCNSVCLNVGKKTQPTLWKVTPSGFGISSLGTNKDQLLHRIQSIHTIH
jgi:hypothetical protein